MSVCGEGEREEGREGERKKGGGEKVGENQEREWGGRGREREKGRGRDCLTYPQYT